VSGPPPVHEPLPGLYDPLLERFRLTRRERAVGLILVWLVRVPGAVRLLTLWHAGRSRR
jgi:hypothetical protein